MARKCPICVREAHPHGQVRSFLGPYRPFLMLGGLILVVATLYWAEMIFIPLALAVLLTFILSPLVTLLQRRGLPRVLPALLVVLFALLILGGAGSGLVLQVRRLAGELPGRKFQVLAAGRLPPTGMQPCRCVRGDQASKCVATGSEWRETRRGG